MQADVILVIGANPTDGHPVFASQMKRGCARAPS
jgi:formate dehydrogenase major subunit